MKIYPIFSTLVDVFVGDGWEQWSRVSIKRGVLTVLAGLQLTADQLAVVQKELACLKK